MTAQRVFALPAGQSINPRSPKTDNQFYEDDQIGYVLWKRSEGRTKPTRVLTSFGTLSKVFVGTMVELVHDQSGAVLGTYEVVGITHFGTGEVAGEVPGIRIKHCVAK